MNEKKLGLPAWRDKALVVTEYLYLFLSALYLAALALNTTELPLRFPSHVKIFTVIFLLYTVLIRSICQLKNRMLWFSAAAGGLLCLVWNFNYFSAVALLMIGAVGIPYRKITKAYLIGVGTVILTAVLVCLSGGCVNIAYPRNGGVRSSWGIIYPTDYAAIILFLLLSLWVCWDKLPDWAALLLAGTALVNAWLIAESNTSCYTSILFLLTIIYLVFERTVIQRGGKLRWMKTTVDILLTAAFPVFGAIMFLAMYCFERGMRIGIRANTFLHSRVQLSVNAWKEIGMTLFGQRYRQVGFGGSTFAPLDYNFIDSSYPRILMLYGIAAFLLVGTLWVLFTHRAIKAGERRLAFALAIIAFHSLSEHHLIEVNYDIFLILTFARLGVSPAPGVQPEAQTDDRLERVQTVLVVLIAAVWAVASPLWLSWTRVWVLSVSGRPNEEAELVLGGLLLCVVILSSLLFLSRWTASMLLRRKPSKKLWALSIAAVGMLVVTAVILQTALHGQLAERNALLEEDRQAVDVLLRSKSGTLFAEQENELYRRKYGGFSRSVFDGEDLARLKSTSVILDEKYNSNVFFRNGFSYARLSDAHGVYTNDAAVIDALRDGGYAVTDYCYAKHTVNLTNRDTNTGEAVHLGGEGEAKAFSSSLDPSLDNQINLYSGRYTASWRLRINPAPYTEDYEVCQIRISAYGGERVLRDLVVYRSWFDDSGELTEKVLFSTGNYPVMDFSLCMLSEEPLTLSELTYQLTPLYDVHITYDSRSRRIRDDYRDSAGVPVMTMYGYACVEYEYDAAGNTVGVLYYDLDHEPVNNRDNYASIRRTFNTDKQVLTETYLDKDGNPVNRYEGYASFERFYNEKRQLSKDAYYDASGAPVCVRDGYAARELEYDEDGNVSVIRYLGTDGASVITQYGYAELRREYDEVRRVISERYFGTDGKGVDLEDGYAGVRYEFDPDFEKESRIVKITYTDEQGRTIVNGKGVAYMTRTLNGAGQLLTETCLDLQGNPVKRAEGYATTERSYNGAGNLWRFRCLDENGRPVCCEEGYAEIRRYYDDNNWLIREEYLDEIGTPVELKNGYACVECVQNEYGRIGAQRFYDLNGTLVSVCDGFRWLSLERDCEPREQGSPGAQEKGNYSGK